MTILKHAVAGFRNLDAPEGSDPSCKQPNQQFWFVVGTEHGADLRVAHEHSTLHLAWLVLLRCVFDTTTTCQVYVKDICVIYNEKICWFVWCLVSHVVKMFVNITSRTHFVSLFMAPCKIYCLEFQDKGPYLFEQPGLLAPSPRAWLKLPVHASQMMAARLTRVSESLIWGRSETQPPGLC